MAKLMEALVHAAPEAVRFEKGKNSAAALFPEFRAWHVLLKEIFGIEPPEWKQKTADQKTLFPDDDEDEEPGDDE